MKKKMILALAVAAMMTACNHDDSSVLDDSTFKTVTFSVTGDFTLTTSPFTRALTADGKDMTDVWVLDYVGNELKQQVHQTSEDAGFGQPTVALTLGEHHLYFVASRGLSPTLNTAEKTLTWTKVYDTFWKAITINVTSGGTDSRTVTLERVITKLRLEFTDAVPDGTASINITPGVWYFGFNYQTGEPCAAANNHEINITVPASFYGVKNQGANIHGFSSATEWTTDIAFNSKNTDGDIIGAATIAAAPFVRNRVTEYTGSFWSNNGGMTLSLNATWDDPYQGTW